MFEASKLNVSVNGPGNKRGKFVKTLTLEGLIEWIEGQQLDELTTKNVVDLAKTYPSHAYRTFQKNFALMVQRVHSQQQQEGVVVDVKQNVAEHEEKTPETHFQSLEDGLGAAWGEDTDQG